MTEEFEYIVVGAGSAGCVLAARLAEAGQRVALIEAGGEADPIASRVPALYATMMETVADWGYRTTPQPELNQRRIQLTRGRCLGGSSQLNAMVYMRGNRGDYDRWRDLGNEGWGYDDLLPLFKRSERNLALGEPFHGQDGGLVVTYVETRSPLAEHFMEACAELQLPQCEDPNGAIQLGYGYHQMTADRHGRCSSYRAFTEPLVASAPNLTVRTNALVTRVLLSGARATGVELFDGAAVTKVHATGEVILCGGSLNSPHLLMLSGIGPAAELRRYDLPVVLDLPGVGQNLHDHLLAGAAARSMLRSRCSA